MPINMELLRMARQHVGKRHLAKYAFVAAGDPAMGAPMPSGGAPPADPSMGGGAPPADPSMGGGAPPMDPSMGGGAPPMDPSMGGAPPMDPMAAMMPMIQQAVQQAMAANGGGQVQASAPGLKPKIDVNVEIVQIKKMLAKIIDALGIHVPVSDMVVTPEDLNQIAQGGPGYAATTPDNKSGGGLGQIQPISSIKAAEAWESGTAFSLPPEYYTPQTSNKSGSVAELATALLMRSRSK
jgi:hypothetical protein